jgi:2-polyprenyl-3-methyl-5-hydroxy-6-metoxy-1,4-benzoquinol methylase
MNTHNFYKKNSNSLINKYDNADMKNLYKLFDKHLIDKSKILDIGFGSTRDLRYLYSKGHDIWGIDPIITFVNNAKNTFKDKSSHFFTGLLPNLFNQKNFNENFDAIICIAVLMHLNHNEYEESIINMIKLVKQNSIIIISYSIGERKVNDEREFYEINTKLLFSLFEKYNLNLIDKSVNSDSLNRDELTWETLVLKYQPTY